MQSHAQHFADDAQLESPFGTDKAAVIRLEHCCRDIKTWMMDDKVKLNDDKTKILLCGPPTLTSKGSTDRSHPGMQVKNQSVNLCQGSWAGR